MTAPIRVYSINFWAEDVNIVSFARYLYDSADIIAYWNYIPLVYCVKSKLSSTELAVKLGDFLPPAKFMVSEINILNLNGSLPFAAWEWFYLEHHEKTNPPHPGYHLSSVQALSLPKK